MKTTAMKMTNFNFKLSMYAALITTFGALSSAATGAYAEETNEVVEDYTLLDAIKQGKSLSSVRARYETVELEGFQSAAATAPNLDNAYAFTTRTLIGWQTAPFKNFSFAAQITDVHEFNDDFNDRRDNLPEHNNGTASSNAFKRQFPNIVDPGFDASLDAVRGRFQFNGRFIGVDDKVGIPLVDMVTFLLKPLDEGTRFHDHIHFGHDDFGCHVYFPSCASARAAVTISST